MIRNPNDIQDGAKKIRMLIAGYPGIGKSTLALSAPRPLHIDCDFGIDRIEPRYRMLCAAIKEAIERFEPRATYMGTTFKSSKDNPGTMLPVVEVSINA